MQRARIDLGGKHHVATRDQQVADIVPSSFHHLSLVIGQSITSQSPEFADLTGRGGRLGLRLRTWQMWISKGEYEGFESSSTGSAFHVSEQQRCMDINLVHCCDSHQQQAIEEATPWTAEETVEMKRSAPRERLQQRTSVQSKEVPQQLEKSVDVVQVSRRASQQVPTETVEVGMVHCPANCLRTSIPRRNRRRGDVSREWSS